MTDRTAFHGFDDSIRNTENSAVTETCSDSGSAIDSGELRVFSKSAQFQSLLDDRRKVFVFSNMYDFRIGNDLCGKHAVFVAGFRRHQAVGGKQDRCRKVRKFFLLVLPGGTEVALKVRILPKLRISVSGKHFTVGINIDPFVLRLFKQLFQVIEVVASDYDKRAFFHHQRYCHWSRIAIGLGIRLVKHFHALEVDLSDFHNNGKQFIHSPVLTDGKESLGKKFIHLRISISQHISMISVCRNSSDSEQDQ